MTPQVTNICVESQFFKDDEVHLLLGLLQFDPKITQLLVRQAHSCGIIKPNATDEEAVRAFTLNSLLFFFNVLAYEDAGFKTLILSPEQEIYEWSAKKFTSDDLVKEDLNS